MLRTYRRHDDNLLSGRHCSTTSAGRVIVVAKWATWGWCTYKTKLARARFVVDNSARVITARDARHRRRTFSRDNRNVSTKRSDIMVAEFPIYFCPRKIPHTIDTAAKNSRILHNLSFFFFASIFRDVSFRSFYIPLCFSRIHSIQLQFFAVLPVYRALWICILSRNVKRNLFIAMQLRPHWV